MKKSLKETNLTPYGLKTEYDSNWVGRYDSTETEINVISIQPTIAFEINPKVSVGLGIQFEYFDAKLESAIDQSAFCLAAVGTVGCTALNLNTPGNSSTDARSSVKVDDWGAAINLGILYQVSEKTQVGLAYRNGINHKMSGSADFTDVSSAVSGLGALTDTNATTELKLPHALSLSLGHKMLKWTLLSDISWRKWSCFEEIRIKFDNPNQPDTVIETNLRDTMRYAIGANYLYNSKIILRTGFAYDQTPNRNAHYRNSSVPDNSSRWFSFGFSYFINKESSIDLAFLHNRYSKTPIDHQVNNDAVPTLESNLNGHYETKINTIGIQYNRKI